MVGSTKMYILSASFYSITTYLLLIVVVVIVVVNTVQKAAFSKSLNVSPFDFSFLKR